MPAPLAIILSESRQPTPAAQQLLASLQREIAAWPQVVFKVVPPLYDLAPDGPAVQYLRSIAADMLVLCWLYPRAAYWTLEANGIKGTLGATSFFSPEELPGAKTPPPKKSASAERTIWCIDLREHSEVAPLLDEIRRLVEQSTGLPVSEVAATLAEAAATVPDAAAPMPDAAAVAAGTSGNGRIEESTRPRWYPVVDYSRCGNCLECLNFCVFGVFGLDESGRLRVEQPDACRPGCPACARVCPRGAIMFPLHNDPAIAGYPVALAGNVAQDLFQLFGTLSAPEQAEIERQMALRERLPKTLHEPARESPRESIHESIRESRYESASASPEAKEAEDSPPPSSPSTEKNDLDRLADHLDELDL